jgi:hypothetical protein
MDGALPLLEVVLYLLSVFDKLQEEQKKCLPILSVDLAFIDDKLIVK